MGGARVGTGMQRVDYGNVKALLVDTNHSVRQLVCSALWSVGIDDVTPCKYVEEVQEILEDEESEVDLVLINIDGERADALAAVRNIRQERLGTNPFLVVMATTWQPEPDVTRPTLEAGPDDLIAAPLSAQILMDRIGNLVHHRKGFVVTMSYVGPERRGGGRQSAEDLPPITVPNTLRYKAIDDEEATAEGGAIERALRTVHTHRVYRVANQLSAEVWRLEETIARSPDRPVSGRKLREIAVLAALAKDQIRSENLEQLAHIGDSLGEVMAAVQRIEAPSRRDLEILRLHGHAIAASIQENDEASALLAGALKKAAGLVERGLH